MLMTLPETQENERATSTYNEYTDTKVSGYISVVFGSNKIIFFADRSCFFSATVHGLFITKTEFRLSATFIPIIIVKLYM
jgi:hypothetical protein